MKPSEIREQTTEELEGLGQELQRKLWRARFDNHTNQLDDTSEIGRLRHRRELEIDGATQRHTAKIEVKLKAAEDIWSRLAALPSEAAAW